MCQNFVLANKSTVSLINNLVWHLHSVYMYIFSIHGNAMWIGTKKEHIASDLTIQRWQVKNTHNKIMWHENLRRIFFSCHCKKVTIFHMGRRIDNLFSPANACNTVICSPTHPHLVRVNVGEKSNLSGTNETRVTKNSMEQIETNRIGSKKTSAAK